MNSSSKPRSGDHNTSAVNKPLDSVQQVFQEGSVTKGRLRGGDGGGRRRRRRCGGGAKSQPPSFHLIQLSSPQRVHNALQIV